VPAGPSIDPKLSVPFSSLVHLLEYHAERSADAPAILAPGRAPLSYGRLYRHIDHMGRTLRAMRIGRHDRIAVVLPNGPEMAYPLNSTYTSARSRNWLMPPGPSLPSGCWRRNSASEAPPCTSRGFSGRAPTPQRFAMGGLREMTV
jgi:hypothetical protein